MSNIPSIAMIPSAYKSGKVYSVLPSDGSGDLNFTRASEATRVNKDGLIETVGSNIPRLNYPMIDGVVSGCPSLLLEPARTNLALWSEDFSNAVWIKNNAIVTANQIIAPDGELTADKLVEDNTNGLHRIEISNSTGFDNTYSIFVKAGERTWVALYDATNGEGRYFDISNGVQGNPYVSPPVSSSIDYFGNGWYRISISTLGTGRPRLMISDNNPDVNYQGDGASGIYIWGAQVEQQSYPTSYIPTSGATVTRSAETCNNAGNASTFNDSEGVLFAEISALDDDLTFRLISLSDGTTSNRLSLGYRSTSNAIYCEIRNGNVTQAFLLGTVTDIKKSSKVAVKYKQNDFALWINGVEAATDTSGITPVNLSKVTFDSGQQTGAYYYGNCKDLRVYNKALSDAELAALTKI